MRNGSSFYDNSKLTVVDAAIQCGYPNEDLFPKRGKTLNYTVNGEARMRRGDREILRCSG